jgi:tripartite-type tricarboxylate transporter receptor subunit TctC
LLPQVPTATEQGVKGVEVAAWYGVFAPAGTPKEIVTAVNAEINKLLATAEMKDAIHAQGAEPQAMKIDEFAQLVKTDHAKWKGIVAASGAKIE